MGWSGDPWVAHLRVPPTSPVAAAWWRFGVRLGPSPVSLVTASSPPLGLCQSVTQGPPVETRARRPGDECREAARDLGSRSPKTPGSLPHEAALCQACPQAALRLRGGGCGSACPGRRLWPHGPQNCEAPALADRRPLFLADLSGAVSRACSSCVRAADGTAACGQCERALCGRCVRTCRGCGAAACALCTLVE